MNIKRRIAVGMAIYKNDKFDFVSKAIESILSQTYALFDFFIQVDGSVDPLIICYLDSIKNKDDRVRVCLHKENKGLAYRLNEVIDIISGCECYEFFARMDADDVSEFERFEKQVNFFLTNPEISVVGSDVVEISEDGGFVKYKSMDSQHSVMLSKIIKRCPLNHPTVMMRTNLFNNGYRYKSELRNTQDYYLWVDMMSDGVLFHNINEPLLKFRVSDDFYSKRGFGKALNDLKSRYYAFKRLDALSIGNIIHVFFLFLLRVSPTPIKRFAYKYFR